MREKAYEVQSNLNDLDVKVWDQSSYTAESNGPWNVTLSVKITDALYDKPIEFIYMIRRDHNFKKTFGCPYYNSDYGQDLRHRPLLEYYNSDLFQRFERALIEVLGEAEHIDHFETSVN